MEYVGEGEIPLAISAEHFAEAVGLPKQNRPSNVVLEELLRASLEVVTRATGEPEFGEYQFFVPLSDWRRWYFPCRPVGVLSGLAVETADGWQNIEHAGWRISRGADEPALAKPIGWRCPVASAEVLRVEVQAGRALRAAARRAAIRVAKEWLDADVSIQGDQIAPKMSFGAIRLIKSIRYIREKEFA